MCSVQAPEHSVGASPLWEPCPGRQQSNRSGSPKTRGWSARGNASHRDQATVQTRNTSERQAEPENPARADRPAVWEDSHG